MREPCDCPSELCLYDEDTEDVVAGGDTIEDAAKNAEKKAKKAARRAAEQAEKDAEDSGDACKKANSKCPRGCVAWYRIEVGEPDSQEYPYHGRKRQFAYGWCHWTLYVKCECVEVQPPKKKNGKPKGKVY